MKIKNHVKDKSIIRIVLVVLVIVFLYAYGVKKKEDSVVVQVDSRSSDKIIVHITGEVNRPGVIELDKGQRLFEAVEMAGGATEDADIDQINLAMILEDQQKVTIPSKNDSEVEGKEDKININTADKERLTELPGIGETIAESIIEYREQNNGFKTIEELKNVHRIGDVTFEKIRDKVTAY